MYPRLFGSHDPQICVLTPHLFQTTFEQENVDPRWLHSGVFEVPPTPDRASWLYVSSGLSNAWEDDTPDPTGPSGLGMEFILQTPSREFWAIDRLAHVIAFQILLSVGEYPGRELLDVHARLPLRCSISPEPSELTWLVVGPPDGLPSSLSSPRSKRVSAEKYQCCTAEQIPNKFQYPNDQSNKTINGCICLPVQTSPPGLLRWNEG